MLAQRLTLGPRIRRTVGPGLYMRISDDVRKCVVFLGFADPAAPGGIFCVGTAFLIAYDRVGYLVTVKHISQALGRDPFLVRVNKRDGTSENLEADGFEWFEHPDSTVDLALIPLHVGLLRHYDINYLYADNLMLSPEQLKVEAIGIGNMTYTVGLFRLLSGEKRNMPICHFGSIAMLPDDERIPIVDWTDPSRERRIRVGGYLVESQSLSGLSGSPVFVRPEHEIDLSQHITFPGGTPWLRKEDSPAYAFARAQIRLLGVWQGSWEAPPDEVRAVQGRIAAGVKVPVGMGIVVPSARIVELLEESEVKKNRDEIHKITEMAAKPQAVARPKTSDEASVPATDANPTHREDFNSLLGAAVRKPAQED